MTSRDEILARVRQRLGDEGAAARRAQVQATLAARVGRLQGVRPHAAADALADFCRRAQALACSVAVVGRWAEAPGAVARYLQAAGLPTRGVRWPALPDLDWAAAGLSLEAREARSSDMLGVTGCDCAIVETGTLMLLGSPASHAVTSLLPETHVALVPASRLVQGMEEAWGRLRQEYGEAPGSLPRAVNFVSGPSRTGDIEQTLVLGAHGPYRVHLVVLRDE